MLLPVFGTGTVLLPWAAYCLLSGGGARDRLLISWGVTNLVAAAAKRWAIRSGLTRWPRSAIYIGWRVKGVIGMLLFPLILVTLCQLNDRGVIRLWKEP